MKKVISLLLTITVVFALLVPVSFAEDDPYYITKDGTFITGTAESNTIATMGSNDAVVVTDTPIGGQTGVVSNATFKQNTGVQAGNEYTTNMMWQKMTKTYQYAVVELIFNPTSNVNRIQMQTVSSGVLGEVTDHSKWNVGRWNTLMGVYDITNKNATFYINGEKIAGANKNADYNDHFRLNFKCIRTDSETDSVYYLQNSLNFYMTNTTPDDSGMVFGGTITNDNLTIRNKNVVLTEDVTVGSLTVTDGYALRVYENSTFATQVSDTASLQAGNVIVLEKDGMIDYYDVILYESTYFSPDSIKVVGTDPEAANATEAVYGMTTVDGVKKYTPRDDSTKPTYYAAQLYFSDNAKEIGAAAKYVVFETDFAGKDILEISVCTDGQQYVTPKLTSGWTEGEWNSLRIVCENPTDDYVKGRTAFYIDGVCVKEFTENTTAFSAYRVSFMFNNAEGELYVKDYKMYDTSTDPGSAGTGFEGTITNEGLNVIGNTIIAPENLTAGSITNADGATIRVYSDTSYGTVLDASAVLEDGNVIVLEKDGNFDYFYVADAVTEKIYGGDVQPTWSANVINAKDDVTAYGGKASGDTSKYYELPANNTAGSLQFVYPLSYHYRYVVAKYSFYFDNDETITGTLITTGGNNDSSYVNSGDIKSGEWNNVIVLIDTQETKSKVYLNGALKQDWTYKEGQFLSDANDSKKYFRLRFEGTDSGQVRTFAVDDFEMYTTTALPEVEKDYKSLTGDYITTADEAFYRAGATVESVLSDAKYQAAGATAVVYDAATGAAVTTGNMPVAAKLALRTDDSTIKSYDLIAVDGIKVWDNGAGTKNGFAFAESGVMIAARYVGGRFESLIPVSVENGMVKAQMNYTGESDEEVKFFVWDSLTGMQPVYPSVTAD